MGDTKTIVVTGDYGIDFDVYLRTRDPNPKPGAEATVIKAGLGGAGLVQRVLGEVANQVAAGAPAFTSHLVANSGHAHAYAPPVAAVWEPAPGGPLIAGGKADVWRLGNASLSLGADPALPAVPDVVPPPLTESTIEPDILVLEDDGARFRFKMEPIRWPAALAPRARHLPEWIVLKMSAPVCHGDLWWSLSSSPAVADRLIVVVPVGHLRRQNVRISEGISWERTALDVVREVTQNPALAALTSARHLVVALRAEGALWIERTGDQLQFHLVFDPRCMENEWAPKAGIKGEAYGFMAAFVAAIAARLALPGPDGVNERVASGIRHGLWAMRLLRLLGHGSTAKGGLQDAPVAALAEIIAADEPGTVAKRQEKDAKSGHPRAVQVDYRGLGGFGQVTLPPDALDRQQKGATWRILEHAGCAGAPDATGPCAPTQPLYGVARRLASMGMQALKNVPYAEFGKLVTADRDEIEALRNIKRLMQGYLRQPSDAKPLSLAAFGPPGAGKSFGIKQIAGEACEKDRLAFLEFNLSQFNDTKDLTGAFHQVRDRVLEGKLPVVFWDEFDSRDYMWLQFLLAPMQDGRFQEGQVTHPIGKCIFVFAGATSYDRKSFGPPPVPERLRVKKRLTESERATIEGNRIAHEQYKLKKGPDFMSRLHGYLNVLGPNRRQHLDTSSWVAKWIDDASDVCFPVRRALLLRSFLKLTGKKENDRMEMDPGLTAALLEVGHYTHGARSMEKIVQGLLDDSHGGFHRSSLPPDEVLGMNVDELPEFKERLARSTVFQQWAEKLAPQIHARWWKDRKKRAAGKPFANNKPFDKLDPDVRASNLAAAMRIPQVLELAGLSLQAKKRPGDRTEPYVATVLESLQETLAEEEHILWMAFQMANGWRQARDGEVRNDSQRVHNCLVPYADLPRDVQLYDVQQVLSYPTLAEAAGFAIVATR